MADKMCPECRTDTIIEGYLNNGYVSRVEVVGENLLKPSKMSIDICSECGLILNLRATEPKKLK